MASREVIRHTSGLEEGGGDSRGRSGRKAAGQECRSEHYYTCRLLIPINDLFHRSGSAEKRLFFLLYGGTIFGCTSPSFISHGRGTDINVTFN